MRVCLVTPYDLSYDGGVNRHVVALADALRRIGHDVRVLGPASDALPPHCDGLPGVVPVAANGSIARVGLLVSRGAVRRYLHEGEFDVVHVHEPCVPGIAYHAVAANSAPRIATFHTYAERESAPVRAVRRALAHPLRRIHCGIAVSSAAADFARRVFSGPLRLIPNGIDMSTFDRLTPAGGHDRAAPARASDGRLHLLFVGRFDEPRKGLRHLLGAAGLLRARGRDVEVQIAGAGDPRPFAELARRAGGRFLGRLDDHALAEAYRACDVFCAPATRGESFGLVLIEAMACGRPVVASDIRGYREASAGAAILVPPGDPEALAEAIVRAADDHGVRRRVVGDGRQRARQLAWNHLARDIGFVYEAAVSGDELCQRAELPA